MVRGTTAPPSDAHLTGLRRHDVGWDALTDTATAESLAGVVVDEPTLDDIVIRIAKENRHA